MDNVSDHLRHVQNAVANHSKHRPESQAHLLDSIRRLQIAAEGPENYAANLRFQVVQASCLLYAVESGVLDAIVAKGGAHTTAEELARSTKGDKLLIVRCMRLLNAVKIGEEVEAETYASNAVAEALVTPEQKAGIRWSAELLWPVAGNFSSYMRESGIHQFPERGEKGPFEFNFGQPMFEYLETHEGPKANFDNYFTIRKYGKKENWFDIYPLARRTGISSTRKRKRQGVLVVDVGGNRGSDLISLAEAHPRLNGRLISQDLSSTVKKLSALPHGIEAMAYDFFTPQPIGGAQYYLMHHICHDWSDERAQCILANTARAMSKDSRLLLHEFVLPDRGAPLRGALFDVCMLMLVCGMERNLSQWKDLLSSAGLHIEKVWHPCGSGEAVIEAKLKC